jgi:hypothetical protein
MKYLIIKNQYGTGCDYTIGCGETYEFVDFDGDLESAIKYFSNPDREYGGFAVDGDFALEKVWIVPADNAISIDLESLRKEHFDKKK